MEKQAIDQFLRRVAYGRNIKKLDSFGSHSGSPFYVYCRHCGVPTEAFPEEPCFAVNTTCSQCSFIAENNTLEEAKKIAMEFFQDDK